MFRERTSGRGVGDGGETLHLQQSHVDALDVSLSVAMWPCLLPRNRGRRRVLSYSGSGNAGFSVSHENRTTPPVTPCPRSHSPSIIHVSFDGLFGERHGLGRIGRHWIGRIAESHHPTTHCHDNHKTSSTRHLDTVSHGKAAQGGMAIAPKCSRASRA